MRLVAGKLEFHFSFFFNFLHLVIKSMKTMMTIAFSWDTKCSSSGTLGSLASETTTTVDLRQGIWHPVILVNNDLSDPYSFEV